MQGRLVLNVLIRRRASDPGVFGGKHIRIRKYGGKGNGRLYLHVFLDGEVSAPLKFLRVKLKNYTQLFPLLIHKIWSTS